MSSDRPRQRTSALAIGSVALVALAIGIGSCRQTGGALFETREPRLRWPPPPAPARIEHLGQLATDRDLKPGRSLGEVLFGDEPTQSMVSPYAVCTDGYDRLFVGDSNAQTVHVFDLKSRKYQQWPAAKSGAKLAQPLGVAWDPRGGLLVADAAAAHVLALDPQGRVRGTIGDGVLQRPCGLVADPVSGRLFVADAAAHQVIIFDVEGRLERRLGERGTEPGRFNFPTNVALDQDGRLYVSDSLNFRVQVFDRELQPLRQIGSQGDRPGYFSQPKGIALDGDGHLYVVDAHFESVQIFDTEGRLLLAFGREGHGAGEFWLPAGIHIDSSNRVWIADSYNGRVQAFQYLGVPAEASAGASE